MTNRKSYGRQIRDLEYKMAKTGVDLSKRIEALKAKKAEAFNRTEGRWNLPNTIGML